MFNYNNVSYGKWYLQGLYEKIDWLLFLPLHTHTRSVTVLTASQAFRFVSKVFSSRPFSPEVWMIGWRRGGKIRWKPLVKNVRSSGKSACGGQQQRDFNAPIEKADGKREQNLAICTHELNRLTVKIGFFRDTIFLHAYRTINSTSIPSRRPPALENVYTNQFNYRLS